MRPTSRRGICGALLASVCAALLGRTEPGAEDRPP
jgi:hypothetical protein